MNIIVIDTVANKRLFLLSMYQVVQWESGFHTVITGFLVGRDNASKNRRRERGA
ncbi:hypothetical protein [Aneurinibacillus thermoaerophilus]|uniref:hypothetical protein n=1 Tax=Aneurinibacillus thermoaerophilus TaxID=143495 RepID=UPI001587A641|nr:hypothetical protein [Aneurinibacillus thermoaerophilus]